MHANPAPRAKPPIGGTRAVGRTLLAAIVTTIACLAAVQIAEAQGAAPDKWVATWSASAHGPYPSGNATAGPDLRFAFPDPVAGAVDQSFRLTIRPGLWGTRVRLRFANTFGNRAVTFDGLFVGLQGLGGNVARGTNRRVTFGGKEAVTIPGGQSAWSDPLTIDRETGTVRAEFQPNSTVGGAGDLLHPNRAGQLAMASAIDLKTFLR